MLFVEVGEALKQGNKVDEGMMFTIKQRMLPSLGLNPGSGQE